MTKELPIIVPDGMGGAEYLNPESNVSNGMWGYPYSGIRMNLMWWDCWTKAFIPDENVTMDAIGYVFGAVVLPFLAVDTVLSATTDTLLVPVDLMVEPTMEHYQSTKCFGFLDRLWPDEKNEVNKHTGGR